MLCGTNVYTERLDRNAEIDRLEDLAINVDVGEAASELVLNSFEDLEASERSWKSIVEILEQIEDYLGDAVAAEKDAREECHCETAQGRMSMLAGMAVKAAKLAEQVAVKGPIRSSFKAKL